MLPQHGEQRLARSSTDVDGRAVAREGDPIGRLPCSARQDRGVPAERDQSASVPRRIGRPRGRGIGRGERRGASVATKPKRAQRRSCSRAISTRRPIPSGIVFGDRLGAPGRVGRPSGQRRTRCARHQRGHGRHARTLYTGGLPKGRGVYVADVVLDRSRAYWNGLALIAGKRGPVRGRRQTQPTAPAIGAAAPRAASPTRADPLGVKPLCTRRPAVPAARRVAQPTSSAPGKPVAVLFATPALCQSRTADRCSTSCSRSASRTRTRSRSCTSRSTSRTGARRSRRPSRRGASRASRGSTRSTARARSSVASTARSAGDEIVQQLDALVAAA